MVWASERGEKRVHPTQKPVALAEWVIQTVAPESETVIDLFGDSGSTLIACERLGERAFLMEMSEPYCDVIIQRWQNFTGQKAINEATGQPFERASASPGADGRSALFD